jgi:hypothetical protein
VGRGRVSGGQGQEGVGREEVMGGEGIEMTIDVRCQQNDGSYLFKVGVFFSGIIPGVSQ